MAVKLRLQRHGRGKRPFYHIVATDSRSPRNGRYIETIGDYNPLTQPATIHIDTDKAVAWLEKGAGYSDTVKAILKYKGILYKKHLLRGLRKGVLTAEQVEAKFLEWSEKYKNKELDHKKRHHLDKEERMAKLLAQEQKKAADREAKRQAALKASEEEAKQKAEEAEKAAAPEAGAAETNETPTEN